MKDQAERRYGQNKFNENVFTGRNFDKKDNETFHNPLKRSRTSEHTEKSKSSRNNHSHAKHSHKHSHDRASSKRTSPSAYKDAIRIRYLQTEIEDYKKKLSDKNGTIDDLEDQISNLKHSLREADKYKIELEKTIKSNPCFLKNGNWNIVIGGMTFTCDNGKYQDE